jgi:hypothetical protein
VEFRGTGSETVYVGCGDGWRTEGGSGRADGGRGLACVIDFILGEVSRGDGRRGEEGSEGEMLKDGERGDVQGRGWVEMMKERDG